MKRKLISLLLAISALSLAGCGELSGNMADEITNLPELAGSAGVSAPDEPEEPAVSADAVPPDDSDAGTAAGDGALWEEPLAEDGTYNSAEDVSLYLHLYNHLPDNYITKNEARELGWTGGSVERYAPGCAIGGDRFGNREGSLPSASGRDYYECDIDTIGGSSRGAKRIIFSNDGLIYYTEDHYESFTLLYGEE